MNIASLELSDEELKDCVLDLCEPRVGEYYFYAHSPLEPVCRVEAFDEDRIYVTEYWRTGAQVRGSFTRAYWNDQFPDGAFQLIGTKSVTIYDSSASTRA